MNDNSNPFADFTTEGLEQVSDTLGGGGVFESGLYPGTITLAFSGKTDGGARFFEIHADTGGGRTYRERLYASSKAGLHYYERDGKKIPLPGFTNANDICLLATGKDLGSQVFEEKVVKLYDFNEKKELPTKVQACTSVIGKQIILGILNSTVNKNVKDANGVYVPTAETRQENTIDKVFHAETGKTVSEFVAKQPNAEFKDKWETKNAGVIRDKTKPVAGNTGMPGKPGNPSGGGSAGKSLFGD